MGKHFTSHHRGEPRINKCLLCVIKDQIGIIKNQNAKIDELRLANDKLRDRLNQLNKEEDDNNQLTRRLKDMGLELREQ